MILGSRLSRKCLMIFSGALLFLSPCCKLVPSFGDGQCLSDGPLLTVLVAGQSNGESLSHTGLTTYSQTGRVSVILSTGNGVFGPEVVPTAASPINYSMSWIRLGDLIYSSTRRPVRIVNVSVGGTSSYQWATGGPYKSWAYNAALAYPPAIIIWVQGEADVTLGFSQDDVNTNLKIIFPFIESAVPSAHFYAGIDSLIPPTAPYPITASPVRRGQQQTINQGYARQGPDIDLLRFNPSYVGPDAVHFENDGLAKHGELWFTLLHQSGEF